MTTETIITHMITSEELITFTGVKPINFGFEKPQTTELKQVLDQWILQSENLITTYCNNDFNELTEIPLAVKNVCLRLSANMVAFAQARKNTPVVKATDWSVPSIIGSDIFTEDLKEDLKPFVKERHSYKADKINIFTVHG